MEFIAAMIVSVVVSAFILPNSNNSRQNQVLPTFCYMYCSFHKIVKNNFFQKTFQICLTKSFTCGTIRLTKNLLNGKKRESTKIAVRKEKIMRKMYFGEDKVNNLSRMYAVMFKDEREAFNFEKLMEIKNGRKATSIPEMFPDYCWAIGYKILDTEDKELFEEEYKEIKETFATWKRARKIVE